MGKQSAQNDQAELQRLASALSDSAVDRAVDTSRAFGLPLLNCLRAEAAIELSAHGATNAAINAAIRAATGRAPVEVAERDAARTLPTANAGNGARSTGVGGPTTAQRMNDFIRRKGR